MVEANGNQMRAVEQLPKEHAIIKLSRQSLVNHFVTRNMDIVLAHMADDVEWMGPFACQTASSKTAMQDILRPEYNIRLALADERWRARQRAGAWIVSACYTLLVVSTDGERSIPFEQRATYVWAPTPDGPRIVHLHVSNTTDANTLLPSLDTGKNAIEFLYEHFDAQGSGTGKISFRDIGGDLHVLHPTSCTPSSPKVRGASSNTPMASSPCGRRWRISKRSCPHAISCGFIEAASCIGDTLSASRVIGPNSTTARSIPSPSGAIAASSKRSLRHVCRARGAITPSPVVFVSSGTRP